MLDIKCKWIFLPTSICVLHSNFWYLHINSLLEWRFYYFHMFRNPVNQFMHLNPLPAVKTFTWTGAERHAWRSRYWRSRGQIVYRRNRRKGARLLQRTQISRDWIPCMGIDLDEISLTATFPVDPNLDFFCSRSLNYSILHVGKSLHLILF